MAYTEFYCKTTGSNLNAGSTDQDAANYTYASGNWVQSTRVFTLASGNTTGVSVGMFASVYANGSTVTGYVGRISAVTSTTITIDATAIAGTAPTDGTGTRTCKVGGRWAGPNAAVGHPFNFVTKELRDTSDNTARVNFHTSATFSITTAMTHTLAGPCVFEGMTSTPGDGGVAVIDGGTSGASYILLNESGGRNCFKNLEFRNNGATGTATGVVFNRDSMAIRCVFHDFRGGGVTAAGLNVECRAYACNTSNTTNVGGFQSSASSGSVFVRCVANDNTGSNTNGFYITTNTVLFQCIADTNGANGFRLVGAAVATLIQCEAYNNTADGVDSSNTQHLRYFENCNFIDNGGYGIDGPSGSYTVTQLVDCGFGSGTAANASGTTNNIKGDTSEGTVTYASNETPWTDPAAGDFTVDNADAIDAGRATFPGSYATAYATIGAAQPTAGGGGGGGSTGISVSRLLGGY